MGKILIKYNILKKYSKTWQSDPPNKNGGFYDGCYGRRYIFKTKELLNNCINEIKKLGYWIKKIDFKNLTLCDKDIYETLFD